MIYRNRIIKKSDLKEIKYIIVGSGFFGSVIAERIANDIKEKVIVLERRNHIGGNCYSEIDDETGIEFHKYGPHIFHTYKRDVWNYINRFSSFNNYRHKVLTRYKGKTFQMPINLLTINTLYNKNLLPYEAEVFIKKEIKKENIKERLDLESMAISLIGRKLYEALIKEYTTKQWETDPKLLPSDIITRLPVRYNYNSDYFDDPWQGIPLNGYTKIFETMLAHKYIDVYLNTDYFVVKPFIRDSSYVVYTGPIDRYYNYKYGRLGGRSVVFKKEVKNVRDYQGVAQMNFAELSYPYTRINEFRHYHEERNYQINKTVIFKEYSSFSKNQEDFYYPINTKNDKMTLEKYYIKSKKEKNVIFGGRLGNYKYYNMDQTIESALNTYKNIIKGYIGKKN